MPLNAELETNIILEGIRKKAAERPAHDETHPRHHKKKLAHGRRKGRKIEEPEEDEQDDGGKGKEAPGADQAKLPLQPYDVTSQRVSVGEEEFSAPQQSTGILARLFGWARRPPPVKVHNRVPVTKKPVDPKDAGTAAMFDKNFDWTACRCGKGCFSGIGKCPAQYPGLPDRVVDGTTIDLSELEDPLDMHGSFVVLRSHKSTQLLMAVKILSKRKLLETRDVGKALNEKAILLQMEGKRDSTQTVGALPGGGGGGLPLRHPFIMGIADGGTAKDFENLYFLLEPALGGDLRTLLRLQDDCRLRPATARLYAAQLTLALHYLHLYDIVHCNVHLGNLVLDGLGRLKLCGFGVAQKTDPKASKRRLRNKVIKAHPALDQLLREYRGQTGPGGMVVSITCGNPMLDLVGPEVRTRVEWSHLAPEVIREEPYGRSADWWGLGACLFEMLAGFPPFFHVDFRAGFQKILAGKLELPEHVDGRAAGLLGRLLVVDPARRLGTGPGDGADVRKHAWFAGLDWKAMVESPEHPDSLRPLEPRLLPGWPTAPCPVGYGSGMDVFSGNSLEPSEVTMRAPAVTNEDRAMFESF